LGSSGRGKELMSKTLSKGTLKMKIQQAKANKMRANESLDQPSNELDLSKNNLSNDSRRKIVRLIQTGDQSQNMNKVNVVKSIINNQKVKKSKISLPLKISNVRKNISPNRLLVQKS
jgi:hypothetical protein